MNNPEYKITPIAFSIHLKGVNPIFGEGITHVKIEDEEAVPFILLSQDGSESIRLDVEELEKVLEVSRLLIKEFEEGE